MARRASWSRRRRARAVPRVWRRRTRDRVHPRLVLRFELLARADPGAQEEVHPRHHRSRRPWRNGWQSQRVDDGAVRTGVSPRRRRRTPRKNHPRRTFDGRSRRDRSRAPAKSRVVGIIGVDTFKSIGAPRPSKAQIDAIMQIRSRLHRPDPLDRDHAFLRARRERGIEAQDRLRHVAGVATHRHSFDAAPSWSTTSPHRSRKSRCPSSRSTRISASR